MKYSENDWCEKRRSKVNQNEREAGGSEQADDLKICDALNREAEKLLVSSWNVRSMQQSVHSRIREGNRMKRCSIKKIIVAACIACTLGSITAVAAGVIASTSSQSSRKEAFYDYAKVDEMEQKLGYTVKAPESFTNGFAFSNGVPKHQKAYDQNGNTLKQAEGLSISYTKSGMADITLSIQDASFTEDTETPDQVFNHNGVALKYTKSNYRFVPANYKVSDEEQAAMDAGRLYISYGADTVTDNVVKSISWKDQGTAYTMLSFDSTLSAEEFGEMAGEVIDVQ